MRRVPSALIVASIVLLAGCAGGISGSTVDVPRSDSTSTTDAGTVSFFISDEANAIDDFRHLNVTITRVGFERTAEDGSGWVERDVDDRTVDLTELVGANATLVDEYDVPSGNYSTVFVHVSDVNATLENGEQVDVKLPSGRLQIQNEFTIDDGAEVDFVFDIAVHRAGNSGKYILRPVINESGTDVPIERVDEDEEDELNATFVGTVSQAENATLEVLRDGEPVENATVSVDDDRVGTTDANGRITFEVPRDEEVEVEVRKGDAEGEIEIEFETEDEDEEDDEAEDEEDDEAEDEEDDESEDEEDDESEDGDEAEDDEEDDSSEDDP